MWVARWREPWPLRAGTLTVPDAALERPRPK
jgi:hypothetical protein